MNFEGVIYNTAKKYNFTDIGICCAEGFEEIRTCLENKNLYLKGLVEQDIEKRIYPHKTMENVKSIIVVSMGYKKIFDFKYDTDLRGKISIAAIGMDYHKVLYNEISNFIEELLNIKKFEFKIFVDTGPLVDRNVAQRAGIGFIGKNTSLISAKNGSMQFLGYILTDLDLKQFKKESVENLCKNCCKCIKACPSKALSNEGFEALKCISYITQKKGTLTYNEMKSIGYMIYGCDVCQTVCPFNKNVVYETVTDINSAMPLINDILNMSNKDFKNRFGFTAAGWRGKKTIQRNALAVLGNIKSKQSFEFLKEFINKKHENEILRFTAVRALINQKFDNYMEVLSFILEFEQSIEIRNEILKYFYNEQL